MMPARYELRCCSLVLISLIAGCRARGIERVVVFGNVTYDGEPVESGFIRFFPIEGTAGPMWGARITAGRFRADDKGGVPVGSQRVEIEAYRKTNRTPAPEESFESFNDGSPTGVEVQYIPAKYNSKSQLRIDLKSGSREVEKDFKLTK